MTRESMCLALGPLSDAYRSGSTTVHDVMGEVIRRIDGGRVENVWLHRATREELHAATERALASLRTGASLPLFGVPFAVKDNIDVAGMPTTAACPAFAYTPETSASVVQRLVDAGAIVVGKVNLDQLATGLVGVRSPYGVPTNPFDARMIPGGSSSGSAVAVAAGHVSFALGTDTAGSGRVPAGFNNVVGLKPSRGALSTRGVVPACRSLDCVSVFALCVADACAVANLGKGWDALDAFSRIDVQSFEFAPAPLGKARIGVPPASQLTFFGDELAKEAFDRALSNLEKMGHKLVEVDFRPFREAGEMLYGGACVAERLLTGKALLERDPKALLPVIRDILAGAVRYSALDAFSAMVHLSALRQSVRPMWSTIDALVLPTAPTIYSVNDVLANPREYNSNIGIYSTFANLLDLAALAVPNGFRPDGLPTGITLFGPCASDPVLIALGDSYHRSVGGKLGATTHDLTSLPAYEAAPPASIAEAFGGRCLLAVVGAHLSGQPLNPQLVGLGARLVFSVRTAPTYRLYALRGTVPPKPGLERVANDGYSVEVEVWSLDVHAFGEFVSHVPRPMCIGSIELASGEWVHGFLCERYALEDAADISHYGGWRSYLRAEASP